MLLEGFLVTVLPSTMVKAGGAIFGPFLLQGMTRRSHFIVVVSLLPVLFIVSSIRLCRIFRVYLCKFQSF